MSTDLTTVLRLEVQSAATNVFVLGYSLLGGAVLAGEADTPESGVEWLDLLGVSNQINIQRGVRKNGLIYEVEAGTMSAVVLDPAVDPNINPYIKPGTPIRLVHDDGFTETRVFTGVIRNVDVTYPSTVGASTRVSIVAVDKVKDLANTTRDGTVAGTFDARVDTLLTKHGIDFTVTGASTTVLAQNSYDSTLLRHLVLAATSEQGRFYVAKDNTVVGLGANATPPASATINLTDQALVLSNDIGYTEIEVGFSSDELANDIWVNNLTYDEDESFNPISVSTKHGPYRKPTSIATYGAFTEEVETNLDPLDVDAFADALLTANASPSVKVKRVKFNSTEKSELAAALEVFDLVNVEYLNDTLHIGEDFEVLHINHYITAGNRGHKWMVDVDLENQGGN